MKNVFILITFTLCIISVVGQSTANTLFNTTDPLDIAFSMSIKTIKASKVDSVYFKEKMYYRNAQGITDSIKIGLKRRGNFRLKQCYFPPLWMKVEKKNGTNTVFEGNKKLKLVMPCYAEGNDLLLREYLCYRLYETITQFSFKTRLVNINLSEKKEKRNRTFRLKGILIEDVDKTAERCGARPMEAAKVNAKILDDTCALRFDLFQLLIANTDWSKDLLHNSKFIYKYSKFIPLPYDFDMSGVVDAPYAVVSQVGSDQLPIENVKERYYRGACTSTNTTQFVRSEFISKEEKLLAVPDELKGELPDNQIESIKYYLKQFFEILKNENLFQQEVVKRCVTK
jgi:hypothetical protein